MKYIQKSDLSRSAYADNSSYSLNATYINWAWPNNY